MLIIDLSNVVITKVQEYIAHEKGDVDENTLRHITLSQILFFRKKFREYGQVVLAIDSKNYWRKDVFKYFKQHRVKLRKDSKMDWVEFHRIYNIIKDELKANFPYISVHIPRVEADDIIAVLTKRVYSHERVMIISADKDMIQLQKKCGNKNIKQYSPQTKKLLTEANSDYDLFTHYIKGDSSDGIPNILSDDDTFICPDKRQTSIYKSFIEKMWSRVLKERVLSSVSENLESDDELIQKFKRNIRLIDVDFIPNDIQESIVDEYIKAKDNIVNNIYKYLIKNRMKLLMKNVGEF